MDGVLESLGLAHLKDLFADESITINDILTLTDADFQNLGITTIGDRARLREKCRDALKDPDEDSPVLKRLKLFRHARSSGKPKSKPPNKNPRETRRINFGWKKFTGKCFQLVPESKGGGKQGGDVPKNASYSELIDYVAEKYFPGGKNDISGQSLDKLTFYVATFTGKKVTEELKSGETFTVGRFLDEYDSSPVRLYLHTKEKENFETSDISALEQESMTSARNPDPETPGTSTGLQEASSIVLEQASVTRRTSCNPDSETPGTSSNIQESSMVIEQESATYTISARNPYLETPGIQESSAARALLSNESMETDARNSDDSFVETNTPTISFRRRPRLQLARTETGNDLSYSSDDETMQEAIRASLENTIPEQLTFKGIFHWWMNKTIKEGDSQPLLIQRGKVFQTTLRAISRPTFEYEKTVKILFSGECGEDIGGPKREFFRELIEEVQDDILDGPETQKQFRHDLQKLMNKKYELAGKFVAWSLLHGGPGLPVLDHNVYLLMTNREVQTVDFDLFEPELKTRLEELEKCPTEEELQEVLQIYSDWFIDQGLVTYGRKIEHKDEMIRSLLKNVLFYRVHCEIHQFIDGLNCVGGLFDAIMYNPDEMSKLFVNVEEKLSLEVFRSLYSISFSDTGSNSRTPENDTIYCFESFLMDCEAGFADVSLEDVLAFWTGAKSIPPLGFYKKMEINFVNSEHRLLPVAHTCGMVLELQRGLKDADDFKNDFVKAIQWCGGFYIA